MKEKKNRKHRERVREERQRERERAGGGADHFSSMGTCHIKYIYTDECFFEQSVHYCYQSPGQLGIKRLKWLPLEIQDDPPCPNTEKII